MILYKQNGDKFLEISVDDSSYRFKEIMGDNLLVLNFSLPEYIDIPTGIYCIFNNEKYTLFLSDNFTKNHTEHYDYTLTLESDAALMRYVKFKFFVTQFDAGEEETTLRPKLKFSHTATPKDFAQLIADNMNQSGYETDWKIDDKLSIDSEPMTLDFNHEDCFSVLAKIANAFNTEWEVYNRTIRIAKVEKNKGSATKLSYGFNNGVLPGISRRQFDSSKVINRLWIQGGDRNINQKEYGSNTLLLPKDGVIRYDGIKFEDEDGFNESKAIEYRVGGDRSFIERTNRQGVISEDSLDVSKIYPMRVGTVTRVEPIDNDKGLYDFIDADIPVDLDYSKCILPDEKMTVIFQSGILTGKEFEISNYSHKDKKFQIVPKTENGQTYPQYPFIPQAKDDDYSGDTYAIFHINLPETYLKEAEDKALREAVKYLYENEQPKYTYDWQLDGIFAKRNTGIIGGVLSPGYFVEFSDPQFLPQPVDIRITAIKEYVNKPLAPQITLSNSVTNKSLGSILNEIPAKEQEIGRNRQEVMEYTKRRWKDTQELIDSIAGISDEFKEHLLNALAFEGLIFRAGAASMQFNFLENDWINTKRPEIKFENGTLFIYDDELIISHDVIKIDDKKPYWKLTGPYEFSSLQADKPYYLYLKASKELEEIDGYMVGKASFELLENKIKLEDREGYYTFWVAFINSENEEKKRSIRTMYGYTEMLPGQVTTDLLASTDGNSFLDFITKRFCLKNEYNFSEILPTDPPEEIERKKENNKKISQLDWNLTKDDTLSIKGMLNCDKAVMAGFKFNNDRIESERAIELDGQTYPAIIMRGEDDLQNGSGYIQLNSVVERWKETGGTKKELQSIKISSDPNNGINISSDTDSVSLSSQGISANRSGIDVTASGINLKATIAGIADEKMNKQYWNNWGTVGVYGTASNDTAGMAPAYGGWFDKLKVNGLMLNTISTNVSKTLTNNDVWVSCNNTNNITINLPPSPYIGQMIMIKRNKPAEVTVSGNGNRLYSTDPYSQVDIWEKGYIMRLLWDGSYWQFGYMYP